MCIRDRESSGGAANENITIGADSGDTIVITGNLQVSGTTTTVNSTTVNLNDHNIVLDSGNSTSAVVDGAGITLEGGTGDDATFTYNASSNAFEFKLGSSFEDIKAAGITAASLDISGDADIDGTLETDALTINGTAIAEVINDRAENLNEKFDIIIGRAVAPLPRFLVFCRNIKKDETIYILPKGANFQSELLQLKKQWYCDVNIVKNNKEIDKSGGVTIILSNLKKKK